MMNMMFAAAVLIEVSLVSCNKRGPDCIMKDGNDNVLGTYESCKANPQKDALENFCTDCDPQVEAGLTAHCEE